tara:strand:+ start:3290 stop:4810 length:1521 start_codon:yes stop_codon:yes gene_type:complete
MAMNPKDKLEDGINGLSRFFNKLKLTSLEFTLIEQETAARTTLYRNQNDIKGGLKTLASTANDVVSQLQESIPTNINNTLGVAKVDKSAFTGLVKPVADTYVAAITLASGRDLTKKTKQKNIVITLPHPEAVAATIKSILPNQPNNEIINLIKQNVDLDDFDTNVIDKVVGNVLGSKNSNLKALAELGTTISDGRSALDTQLSYGFSSLVENIIENIIEPAASILSTAATVNGGLTTIPSADIKSIIQFRENGRVDKAVDVLSRSSDLPRAELTTLVNSIDNRASVQAQDQAGIEMDIPVVRTDTFTNVWREENTDVYAPGVFESINDLSAFENEIANLQREVTEIIIYAQAGADPQGTTTIETWHESYVEQQNTGYEPHIYIDMHGATRRGRPLSIDLPGDVDSRHDKRSIVIHIESSSYPYNRYIDRSLKRLLASIYRIRPGIQVFGYGDISTEDDLSPYFDVDRYIKNTFGKENVKGYNPKVSESLTMAELSSINEGRENDTN